MGKKTSRKKNTNKKYSKKKNLNRNKRLTHKKYKGGDETSSFKSVILSILNDNYIPFLPSSKAINDKDIRNNYLSCVSAFDLLSIIGNSDKYSNSKTITSIVKEIDSDDNKDVLKLLGNLTKVPISNKVMSKFIINCSRLKNNQFLKQLREYILECEDYISIKYVNWYKVTLGLISFDDDFENTILKEIKDRKIYIDTDKFRYGLDILYKDDSVKKMFKQRVIECGYKPQGFFDKLTGNISWDSYNECFKCSDNKCIVYLDENYNTFLHKKHRIKSIDKIKILIYVDLRLRLFSKYIALEGLRIIKKKHSLVKNILNNIYKLDYKNNKLNNIDLKQSVMNRIIGGSDMFNDPSVMYDDPNVNKEASVMFDDPNLNKEASVMSDDPNVNKGASNMLNGSIDGKENSEGVITPGPETSNVNKGASNMLNGSIDGKENSEGVITPGPETSNVNKGASNMLNGSIDGKENSEGVITPGPETSNITTIDDNVESKLIETPNSPTVVNKNEIDNTSNNSSILDSVTDAVSNIFGENDEASENDKKSGENPVEGVIPESEQVSELTSGQNNVSEQITEKKVETSDELNNSQVSNTTQLENNQVSNVKQYSTDDSSRDKSSQQDEMDKIQEDNLKSSDIIYLTFKDSKISYDEVEIGKMRNNISEQVKSELDKLTGVTSKETLKIHRIRFGPVTTSVEIIIDVKGDEKLKENDIKDIIIDNILQGNLTKNIFIPSLDLLKEIYFDGISKYSDIKHKHAKYKRLLFEIPGIYPLAKSRRVEFEENIINSIKDILGNTELEIERIHLERISRVNNNKRVIVQFLIMDGDESSLDSNDIIMNFKQNYEKNTDEYYNKYQVNNVVFGEPSIILDDNEYSSSTLTSEMKLVEDIDKNTLNKLTKEFEGKYNRIAYNGCDLTLDALKNNLITSTTPLFNECNSIVEGHLNNYI